MHVCIFAVYYQSGFKVNIGFILKVDPYLARSLSNEIILIINLKFLNFPNKYY